MPLVRKPQRSSHSSKEPSTELGSLTSVDADERWAAARAATDVEGTIDTLATALRTESDARVREAIFSSLARFDSRESAEALLSALRSDDAMLRSGALDAMRVMTQGLVDLLPAMLADDDVDVRILSCELARGLPNSQGASLLYPLLDRETDVNVCAAAIDVITEIGGPDAVAPLTRCAKRFENSPFLIFAATIAVDRIATHSASHRG